MKNKTIFRIRREILLPVMLILLILNVVCAYAQDTSEEPFSEVIARLIEKNIIPAEEGKYLSFGDFEDTYANMGYLSATPLLEAERFVFSADISWSSANQTPNSMTSGCGVFFNSAENGTDYLLLSLRMDGALYVSGIRNYSNLTYGRYPIATPSIIGSAKLLFVVNGSQVVIYLGGQPIAQRNDLTVLGNLAGLAVLSGTYQDFGTRCVFRNIQFYVW